MLYTFSHKHVISLFKSAICGEGTDLLATTITSDTATGWNKPATDIQYGKSGLVGHNWEELRVQFDFGTRVKITGMECDYTNNPYTIRIGDNYEQEVITSSGSESKNLDEVITVQKIQVGWSKTDGPKRIYGNLTVSRNNGIHFRFLVCLIPSSGKFQSLI